MNTMLVGVSEAIEVICRRMACATLMLGCILAGAAQAADIKILGNSTIANNQDWETAPTVCKDAVGPYVTYTIQQPKIGGLGPGDIVVQRLKDGAAYGAPMVISGGVTDDQFNDCDGNYIVYTAFSSDGVGQVMLYDLSMGTTTALSQVGPVREARINGTLVVWIEDYQGAPAVVMWDLAWTGTGILSCYIAGPSPPTSNLAIDSRFAVWSELIGKDRKIMAYDRTTGTRVTVANDPTLLEILPDTDGDWVVWMARGGSYSEVAGIYARNIATGEFRTVAENIHLPPPYLCVAPCLTVDDAPKIDGDFIVYVSYITGSADLYLYRISDGRTFQLTNDSGGQGSHAILGKMVAYVDTQSGNANIKLIQFDEILPIANAGQNQTTHVGVPVTLSGSGSYDETGVAITGYSWAVESGPSGSSLANPNAMTTDFTPYVLGNYVLSLRVTNANGDVSIPATVVVSTTNTAPVADAGPDQALLKVGSLVTLDGSKSYDVDGDPIGFKWELIPPSGSKAVLKIEKGSPIAQFVADVKGEYVAVLTVYDAWSSSKPATVKISFTNLPPVANAGTNQTVIVGTTVTLNGNGSSDPNGDTLRYSWSLASTPAGSGATLSQGDTPTPSLATDMPGDYVVSLVVYDWQYKSTPSNVTIMAITQQTQVTQQVIATQSSINNVDFSFLKNSNMKNSLTNKMQAVMADIEAGLYANALSKLQTDIIKKTDGCAIGGAPDNNDWINDCATQRQVYPLIQDAINMLQKMI